MPKYNGEGMVYAIYELPSKRRVKGLPKYESREEAEKALKEYTKDGRTDARYAIWNNFIR